MKQCPKCGHLKQFSRNAARYDGLAVWCKDCTSAYNRQRNAKPKVKVRSAELALARYHALPEQEKVRRNKQKTIAGNRLKNLYKLTVEDYERMLAEQGGGCAICGAPPKQNRLSVDHDHACCPGIETCGNCVRGLLCVPCNRGLGYLENPAWISAAQPYLERSTLVAVGGGA